MADRLSDITSQIQNVRQLNGVVTAIRGIAGSRAQRGRSLLAGIEAYSAVISRAIGEALKLLPAEAVGPPLHERSKRGLILFCAEQGFAGAFSERVFEAAGADVEASINFVVGTRGLTVASERRIKPDWSTAMTTRVEGVPDFANALSEALYRYLAQDSLVRVDILFSRSASGSIRVDRHSLLPIDFSRFASPQDQESPLITLAPDLLLERLAAEYIYAQLCEAAMHAIVAENEARMIAMLAAKNNTDTKLTALLRREQQLRQEEITTEIVELAAGAEAARSASDH
jgi:F-type H+-transporting ATPase subunit gamma